MERKLYTDVQPGQAFVADLGYGGGPNEQTVVAQTVGRGKSVFGTPRVEILTTCGLDLVFDVNDCYYQESSP